ncbi:hypothetical protein GCM10011607_28830 [Shewanella inventionis]|uniref:Uncharacterized protein n=1 Tax=Shewanella inventionis TaxID=1738770 RepID=A0ABQ1JEE3_9GAMM|nr:hypothetical protein [Shewanella inventionis]GGB66444.1 hypothetical protein GCM10011607_28830 [Shewanella inventionis]
MDESIDAMLLAFSKSLPVNDNDLYNEALDDSFQLSNFDNIDSCNETEVLSLLDWFKNDPLSIKIILESCEENYEQTQLELLLERLCYTELILNELVVNMVIKHHSKWKTLVTTNLNGICPVTLLYLKKQYSLIDILLSAGLTKRDLMGIKPEC